MREIDRSNNGLSSLENTKLSEVVQIMFLHAWIVAKKIPLESTSNFE